MYKPKETESELIIYQKYMDLVEYGYNFFIVIVLICNVIFLLVKFKL